MHYDYIDEVYESDWDSPEAWAIVLDDAERDECERWALCAGQV